MPGLPQRQAGQDPYLRGGGAQGRVCPGAGRGLSRALPCAARGHLSPGGGGAGPAEDKGAAGPDRHGSTGGHHGHKPHRRGGRDGPVCGKAPKAPGGAGHAAGIWYTRGRRFGIRGQRDVAAGPGGPQGPIKKLAGQAGLKLAGGLGVRDPQGLLPTTLAYGQVGRRPVPTQA